MPALAELLRPPAHRGPLIAAGAVLLTLGLALLELRLGGRLAAGVHLLILAPAAALVLGLGVQAPNEDGQPPAYQSVLLVCGLLLLAATLGRLADVLGADLGGAIAPGTQVWTGIVMAAVSGWVAATRRSAVCALLAAAAAAIAVLAAVRWIFDPGSFGVSRWILLVLAGALVVLSLGLRGRHPRHAELLVDAAALAILAIALQGLVATLVASFVPFGGSPGAALPGFWELVVLAAGCGLVAYGAIDRAPGPAWLGVANLVAFLLAVAQGGATLRWWPVVLLVLGLGTMAAGLRPRDPLPPEPPGYRSGEQPLASRTAEDDEVVVRVRDDGPASG
jgi:hypothetical protein